MYIFDFFNFTIKYFKSGVVLQYKDVQLYSINIKYLIKVLVT